MITAHFVAGYGSGPKTIMPGASGYQTIFHNHGVVSMSPDAKMGITVGNPCWEDMAEVTSLLGPTLAVDVVLNTRDEIVAAFHGTPISAQRAGLGLYNSIYGFHLNEKADIVIAKCEPNVQLPRSDSEINHPRVNASQRWGNKNRSFTV